MRAKPDKIPHDNASLRQAFSDMTKERLEGRNPFGGHGSGLAGCTHYFRERYKLTDEEAAALAVRLHGTMTRDW
jgi:hypothetical protein